MPRSSSSQLQRGLWVRVLVAAAAVGGAPAPAAAAEIRAIGGAKLTEWETGATVAQARARAIGRARAAALKQALETLEGPVDSRAAQATMADADGWTGVYRILSVTATGTEVEVELEVDVDLGRLSKRVAPVRPPQAWTLRYHQGRVHPGPHCGGEAGLLASELARLGIPGEPGPNSSPIHVTLRCSALGAVPNTLLRAVRLRATATVPGRPSVAWSSTGFGVDDASAQARVVGEAADAIAAAVAETRQGVELRVEAPHPASRIRRLQRALRRSVRGVRGAEVVAIDADGAVRLWVQGRLDAEGLARELEALSLPDFSLSIVAIDDAPVLTVRLLDRIAGLGVPPGGRNGRAPAR